MALTLAGALRFLRHSIKKTESEHFVLMGSAAAAASVVSAALDILASILLMRFERQYSKSR